MMFKDRFLALFPIWTIHAKRLINDDVIEIAQSTKRLHAPRIDKSVSQKTIVYMHADNSTKNACVRLVTLCF